jgi:anti-sigma B factor antagonist
LPLGPRIANIGIMEWTVSTRIGVVEVVVTGDCDLYSAPAFAAAMLARIREGATALRLDFSGVDYLDSTGVGAIIRMLQEAKKRGCALSFRGIGGSPRKVLRMSNILGLLREDAGR